MSQMLSGESGDLAGTISGQGFPLEIPQSASKLKIIFQEELVEFCRKIPLPSN